MASPFVPSSFGSLPKLPHLRTIFQTLENKTIDCVPSDTPTNFENCNKLGDVLDRCKALINQNRPKQEYIDCFCTQEVLSAYVGLVTVPSYTPIPSVRYQACL